MAEATYNPGKKEVREVVIEEPSVTVTMTVRQAQIIQRLGGGSTSGTYHTPNKPLTELYQAFRAAGVPENYNIGFETVTGQRISGIRIVSTEEDDW